MSVVVPVSDLQLKQEHVEKLSSQLIGQNTVHGVPVQPDVALDVNQEHERVSAMILVVALVLDLRLKLEHAEKLLSQPVGQTMVRGVPAQANAEWEVNQEYEHVRVLILAVVPVLDQPLKPDLAERPSLIPDGESMDHGLLAL